MVVAPLHHMKPRAIGLLALILSCFGVTPSLAKVSPASHNKGHGKGSSRAKIWVKDQRGLRKISVHAFQAAFGVKWTGRQLLKSGLTKANLGYADGFQSFDWQNPDAEPRIDPRHVPAAAEQRAIRGQTAPLYIGKAGRVGNGLFARAAIAKGAVIGEYTGVARQQDRTRDRLNGYTFVYDPFQSLAMVVDAKERGNYLRFANHSAAHANACSKIVYDTANKRWHTLLIAKERISKDDQVLFDYGRGYDWGRFGIAEPVDLKPR
jgi:hypothetical protein